MSDIRRMQVGTLVDFCISYNDRQKEAEKQAEREEKHPKKRKATQAEIDAYFGR